MSDKKHWPRWIFASVSRHFTDNAGGLDLFIEGQDTRTLIQGKVTWLELRVDGPRITEISKNFHSVFVEINMLVSAIMNGTNFHVIHTNVGIVAEAFITIQLFKFGDGSDDNGSLFGCLDLVQDKRSRDFLEINHFGQIDRDRRLVQATVEGHYSTHLTL